MLKSMHSSKLQSSIILVANIIFCALLFCQSSCSASVSKQGMTGDYLEMFSANNIMFYDPSGCMRKNDINAGSCFKIDNDTDAIDRWYAEGCLDNGGCASGIYASTLFTDSSSPNHFLLSDTMIDEDFGGMEYIYAENYDIEFDAYEGWIAKFTPNGGTSDRKYYWIVLPDKAYTHGFGETYVATFENLSEPVYFITYDAHACPHQHAKYCEQAEADPNGVEIGKEFFGAFTKNGGSYNAVVDKIGQLKTFCRIRGKGSVEAHESSSSADTSLTSASKKNIAKSSSSSDYASSASDNKVLEAVKDIIELANKNGSTYTFGGGHGSQSDFDSMLNDGAPLNIDCTGFASLAIYKAYGEMTSFTSESIFSDPMYEEIDRSEVRPGDIFAYNSPQGHGGIVIEASDGKVQKIAETGGTEGRSGSNNNIGYSGASGFSVTNMNGENGHFFRYKNSVASADCNSFEGDYPQYYQGDYENSDHENSDQNWTKIPYGAGYVDSSGCGPTSMAMLTTVATGKDVYPQDIIRITKPTGDYTAQTVPTVLDKIVGEEYGFEVEGDSYDGKKDAYNKIKDYLNKGYMIHLSGEGVHAGFSNYATDGHYIGLFRIDSDDKVWVANSNSVGNSQVPLQSIIDAIHNGGFSIIKANGGKGGGSGSCFSYCEDGGGSGGPVGDDGLTIEQAKTFMMNYGENKNDSSRKTVGDSMWNMCNGGGSNCVTFSAFFMLKFTSIKQDGLWGNGNQVVPNLKARSSVDATFGTEPRVYAVLSTPEMHTAVVLGHHDGKWIVGHASCGYQGKGRGNGGSGNLNEDGDMGWGSGGGSGFIAIEESDDPANWQWLNPGYSFAYPTNVDTAKIEEYLKNGV